jgi:Pyruvate/2-oxoacid:ferredoxin oxidoreductase delta subunit
MLASSGYVAQVDDELCISCDTCAEYCQFGALEMSDLFMGVDYEKCMGCGVCADKCEQGAIVLTRDEAKGIPLEICALMESVPK